MCHILDPDVFVITESWLKDFISDTEITGPTYKVHRNDRKNKGGGGVLILVKSHYFSERREEMIANNNKANEILPVEIKNDKGHRLLIVGAYRPDSDSLNSFIPNLDFTLCTAYQTGYQDIVITGDFNTRNIHWDDELDYNLSGLDLQFCILLDKYGLTQLVKEPTKLGG